MGDYVPQGRAAEYLRMRESELVKKLRAGVIKGVYNPVWAVGSPCWWVSLNDIEKFNRV